ncbi:MAG: 3'(2'),5'-bisphosphate nucleotidase CysQ [Bacteroidales bacterium]|nr:3'(2'),5'-bisphosphate nucleotidase CysQ [Bacteroidales bacterium]
MSSYRNIIIPLAVKAGQEILKYYKKNTEISYKIDNSPLTEADLAANRIIIEGLENTKIPIISEETENVSYEIRKLWDKFWIIDPLDGTKQFVKNEDEFTVNIALIVNNKPVEGVVYAPALNVLYYGHHSYGAEKIIFDQDFQSVKIVCNNSDLLRIVASKSHLNDATKAYLDEIKNNIKEASFVNVGSSLKFCLVAEGRANLYPRIGPINEWDIAAGHAILKAAGGYVLNMKTGLELEYNSDSLLTPDFIAFSNLDLIKNIGILNLKK